MIEGLHEKVESLRQTGGWVLVQNGVLIEDSEMDYLLRLMPKPPESWRNSVVSVTWVPAHEKDSDA